MNRRRFIKGTIVSMTGLKIMNLNKFDSIIAKTPQSEKMPVLFVGHGSPMNAIEVNEYSIGWKKIAKGLPSAKAILCISAHWLTKGSFVTAMPNPKTIHDFSGFPNELNELEYKAPGSVENAKLTTEIVNNSNIALDYDWGLDHGTWSVLAQMYPKADIPVFQLSIDYNKPAKYHYELAKQLQILRTKGILIIGSGNIVHNLRMMSYENKGFDWADEFDQKIKNFITDRNDRAILDYKKLGKIADLAVPTPDHYYPLLYTIAVTNKNETIEYFNDKTTMGSISMRSLKITD